MPTIWHSKKAEKFNENPDPDCFSEKKLELYKNIYDLFEAGYSLRAISRKLRCSRNTVTKYLCGDMENICMTTLSSGVDIYRDYIMKSLADGVCRSNILRGMRSQGLKCGNTAAYDYMNKLAAHYGIELIPMRNCSPEQKEKRKEISKYTYVSRKTVFRFLWMGEDLDEAMRVWIFEKYPDVRILYTCIHEFREIFRKEHQSLMIRFIEKYRDSGIKLLSGLARSFEDDIDAILNAISSRLSNGFVEGTNNKLKMVNRTMYGRCSRMLLAAKLMLKL